MSIPYSQSPILSTPTSIRYIISFLLVKTIRDLWFTLTPTRYVGKYPNLSIYALSPASNIKYL